MKLELYADGHNRVNWRFVDARGNVITKGVQRSSLGRAKKQVIAFIQAVQKDDFEVFDLTKEKPAKRQDRIVSRRVSRSSRQRRC